MSSIQAYWEEWSNRCYPDGFTPEQKKQIWRAFLIGIDCTLCQMDAITQLSDDAGVKQYETFRQEFLRYLRDQINSLNSRQ